MTNAVFDEQCSLKKTQGIMNKEQGILNDEGKDRGKKPLLIYRDLIRNLEPTTVHHTSNISHP